MTFLIFDLRFLIADPDRFPQRPRRQAEPAPNVAKGEVFGLTWRFALPLMGYTGKRRKKSDYFASESEMRVQAVDVSPVIPIFDVFWGISQLQGFGFSPVRRIPEENFSAGCQRTATSLHPIRVRRAQRVCEYVCKWVYDYASG